MTVELSRQVFLRGALGVAATAMLGSCGSTASGPAPATPSSGDPSTPPSRTDWDALDDAIDGHVLLPSDDGYPAAKTVFNARFATSTPVAVVAVQSTADVQRALAFAATNGVTVTARSGGHSYGGASTANGTMVVDLRQMPGGIAYDDGTGLATVSAAADLNSLQRAINAFGRSIPTGSCPSVGVAGLTLGGGLGADARRYGLTCDALASASVVLPGGEAVTATPDDHPICTGRCAAAAGRTGASSPRSPSGRFRSPTATSSRSPFPKTLPCRSSSAGISGLPERIARSGAWSP